MHIPDNSHTLNTTSFTRAEASDRFGEGLPSSGRSSQFGVVEQGMKNGPFLGQILGRSDAPGDNQRKVAQE